MNARDPFAELMQGVEEMSAQREGKTKLRNTSIQDISDPDIAAQDMAGTEVEHDT